MLNLTHLFCNTVSISAFVCMIVVLYGKDTNWKKFRNQRIITCVLIAVLFILNYSIYNYYRYINIKGELVLGKEIVISEMRVDGNKIILTDSDGNSYRRYKENIVEIKEDCKDDIVLYVDNVMAYGIMCVDTADRLNVVE